jgi:integrase
VYPDVLPERARVIATKMRSELAENRDPNAERIRQRTKGVTLREAFEAFEKIRRKLKPRTIRDYRRFLETVFADWVERPFVDITRDRVGVKHAEVTKNSGPAHADNAMRSLRSILNFAMVQFEGPDGERPMSENPVARLSQTRAWNRVKRRTTVIAEHQLRSWFAAVLELKQMPPTSQDALVADYLLFMILTGVRRSEAGSLRKDHVDLRARTFTLRDTKNRDDHVLPLSDYLVDLLRIRMRVSGEGRFVFPGDGASGHLVEPRPQMRRVTARSGVPFTLHDLRRTFGTVAESLDIPAYALKRLLNHKSRQDVTAGYLIITPERLREPMQKVTDYFLKSAGIRESAKVVRLDSERKR